MQEKVPSLIASHSLFVASKDLILEQWVSYSAPKQILILHKIDRDYFIKKYASGVFDYFMGVISGTVEIGNCPVMQELLTYLKIREISADELFAICSHFRRSMVDFSYDAKLNSKELFDEISYIFDENFKGILKFYTDTIFQKLIDARQDALRASQAKEYFLSNMSHEIRTPLNAILGFVNLLLDEDIGRKHRNYLDIIHNSGENLLSIINDILDFSKLRSGEFTIDEKVFSLHEELSHTMELFVASANVKDITITSFIDPKIPVELFGDALRINQILSNFLSNAIKFTPVKGVIKIEASYVDGILQISVNDTGIGICDEDIEKVFTAFAQAQHSLYENHGGTGLGLSICNQLAQKMQGEVSVISKVEEGSTFILRIPINKNTEQYKFFEDIEEFQSLKMRMIIPGNEVNFKHDSFLRYAKIFKMNIEVVESFSEDFDIGIFVYEDLTPELESFILKSSKKFVALMSREYDTYDNDEHVSSMCYPLYCSKIHTAFDELLNPVKNMVYAKRISLRFKGHVLVAEDNEANQELIKIVLQKYGLSFEMAENGFEALTLFKANRYDLVLMDEQMPVMNGNEAVEKIIAYEEAKGIAHTPISALTANVLKGAKEHGLLSGFDAFLGKPIVLKELERVFSTYLKIDTSPVRTEVVETKSRENMSERIIGLDSVKLTDELMLSEEELIMLLKLFIKKMYTTMPKLQAAIDTKDYKQIALLAHSIKGSSGNFRIKILQELSNEMEIKAKEEDRNYEYNESFTLIEKRLESIRVT